MDAAEYSGEAEQREPAVAEGGDGNEVAVPAEPVDSRVPAQAGAVAATIGPQDAAVRRGNAAAESLVSTGAELCTVIRSLPL